MLSRTHYQSIAKLLKERADSNEYLYREGIIKASEREEVDRQLTSLVEDFCAYLSKDNEAFDENRFLSACTPEYVKEGNPF